MRKRKSSKQGRQPWTPELEAEIERGTDLTREIAKAKGHAKRHGPWQTRCPHCNELIALREAKQVPPDLDIVPVYLRVWSVAGALHFHVVKCSVPREGTPTFNSLEKVSYNHLVWRNFSLAELRVGDD